MKKNKMYFTFILTWVICTILGSQVFGEEPQINTEKQKDIRIILMIENSGTPKDRANIIEKFNASSSSESGLGLFKSAPDYKAYDFGPYNENTKYSIQYADKKPIEFQFKVDEIKQGNKKVGQGGVNYPEEWKCILRNIRETDDTINLFFTIGLTKCD